MHGQWTKCCRDVQHNFKTAITAEGGSAFRTFSEQQQNPNRCNMAKYARQDGRPQKKAVFWSSYRPVSCGMDRVVRCNKTLTGVRGVETPRKANSSLVGRSLSQKSVVHRARTSLASPGQSTRLASLAPFFYYQHTNGIYRPESVSGWGEYIRDPLTAACQSRALL